LDHYRKVFGQVCCDVVEFGRPAVPHACRCAGQSGLNALAASRKRAERVAPGYIVTIREQSDVGAAVTLQHRVERCAILRDGVFECFCCHV
jgi:hypothetical protein